MASETFLYFMYHYSTYFFVLFNIAMNTAICDDAGVQFFIYRDQAFSSNIIFNFGGACCN